MHFKDATWPLALESGVCRAQRMEPQTAWSPLQCIHPKAKELLASWPEAALLFTIGTGPMA